MKKIKIKVSDIMIAILLVFALLIFYLTKDWQEASYIMGFGPGFYPRVLSTILIGLLIILFFEEMAKSRKHNEESISEKKGATTKKLVIHKKDFKKYLLNLKWPAILFFMMFLYTMLLDFLGFIPDTILFLIIGMVLLGGNLIKSIIISGLFTISIYFLFGYLLKVQLPMGVFFGG